MKKTLKIGRHHRCWNRLSAVSTSKDIKAPECFYIERELRKRCKIPVFHDDQHGTAIITAAAVLNALRYTGRKIEEATLVCSGAGAGAIACLNQLLDLGLKRENVTVCDSKA